MIKKESFIDEIKTSENIYVYGGQAMAYGIYLAIKETLNKKIEAFIISELSNNHRMIEDIPVKQVGDKISKQALIIIATPEIYHEEIGKGLRGKGYFNIIYLDSKNEYILMSRYFRNKTGFLLLEDLAINGENKKDINIKMYMAKHFKDKKLSKKYDIPSWIKPIQVGAALTDIEIADLKDNTGDNISEKNYNYSELTAMYWVWKNRQDDYMGICHYRRILNIKEEDIMKIKSNNINAVVPLPFACYPDTKGQYGRYISERDQVNMFQALKDVWPNYYEEAKEILKGKYLYNYNMFLADRKTYYDFCSWLFPILKRAEGLCEPKDIIRKDRYMGYLAEVYTAIYFLLNKNNLKIVHGEKIWMI